VLVKCGSRNIGSGHLDADKGRTHTKIRINDFHSAAGWGIGGAL